MESWECLLFLELQKLVFTILYQLYIIVKAIIELFKIPILYQLLQLHIGDFPIGSILLFIVFVIIIVCYFITYCYDTDNTNTSSSLEPSAKNSHFSSGFYDGAGNWRTWDQSYQDASGTWRNPGDSFIDGKGTLRNPGDDWQDSDGNYYSPGQPFKDGKGNWRS